VTPLQAIATEAAHEVGVLPLAWLGWRQVRWSEERRPVWWLIATAFAVSWVADSYTHARGQPWLASAVYPVSQAGLIGVALLEPRAAARFIGVLVAAAIAAVALEGVEKPGLLLHAVAFGAVVGMAWNRPELGRLRVALLVAFGVSWPAWVAFSLSITWTTWGIYEAVRVLGLILFCWACLGPAVQLTREVA
jgi:hypothetical protein